MKWQPFRFPVVALVAALVMVSTGCDSNPRTHARSAVASPAPSLPAKYNHVDDLCGMLTLGRIPTVSNLWPKLTEVESSHSEGYGQRTDECKGDGENGPTQIVVFIIRVDTADWPMDHQYKGLRGVQDRRGVPTHDIAGIGAGAYSFIDQIDGQGLHVVAYRSNAHVEAEVHPMPGYGPDTFATPLLEKITAGLVDICRLVLQRLPAG